MTRYIQPELCEVQRRIEAEGLNLKEAARAIGVGVDVISRHLAGSYVRSDSLGKYRRWLWKGEAPTGRLALVEPRPLENRDTHSPKLARTRLVERRDRPERAHLVVDLFSGCGGMSLGFDLVEGSCVFETVLAIDNEEPMVRAFNANHERARAAVPVCRQMDLSDVLNEAEVLGYYLDHLAELKSDDSLRRDLDALPHLGMSDFLAALRTGDATFVAAMKDIQKSTAYRAAVRRVPAGAFAQTSVIGFHNALALPMAAAARVDLPPLVWADAVDTSADGQAKSNIRALPKRHVADLRRHLSREWASAVRQLAQRARGSGRGQLASSAARIRAFLAFLDEPVVQRIRTAWIDWQANRRGLRRLMFDDATLRALRDVYDVPARRIAVLLGGPPCQGFSRIGRGKIRSLREQHVHVQADSESVDARNRLLHQYVLFVSALRPTIFLFENVRHFQAEVKTPDTTYLASEVLAEAIREVSSAGLQYVVANRIIDASRHLVPQTRERFFMAGVRADAAALAGGEVDVASWCLALPDHEPLPISAALDGLPPPVPLVRSDGLGLRQRVQLSPIDRVGEGASAKLMRWLRQQGAPGGVGIEAVDSHVIRPPRRDDSELFSLFGPGKRWMDYRCDQSETLRELQSLLASLSRAVAAAAKTRRGIGGALGVLRAVDREQLERITAAADGSLSLRLLLEQITPLPGELRHHLVTPGYLAKREGNHGDWLARLHANRPSKTVVSHMAKDTYAYVHPFEPRTLSVREAARIQTFPDRYRFGCLGLVEAFRVIGNAVPPFLSNQIAERVAELLQLVRAQQSARSALSAQV